MAEPLTPLFCPQAFAEQQATNAVIVLQESISTGATASNTCAPAVNSNCFLWLAHALYCRSGRCLAGVGVAFSV